MIDDIKSTSIDTKHSERRVGFDAGEEKVRIKWEKTFQNDAKEWYKLIADLRFSTVKRHTN